jgi:Uma2 family endonuclease
MAEPVLRPLPEESDPFYWGSRLVRAVGADGESYLQEVPLTRNDILDPQEGDMMMQGPVHDYVARILTDMIDRWFTAEDVAVYHDVKILWGIDGLSDPAPDISVIKGVRNKLAADRASFSVPEEGVRPCLVIELISPRYEEIDRRDKLQIYERAGVPEHLIIDITSTPVRIDAYRMSPAGTYLRCPPGHFESHTTGLCFKAGTGRLEINVEDAATGERLLTSHEESAARRAAERRAASEAEARRVAEKRAVEAETAREALEAELKSLRKRVGRSEE